ncbi:MAG: carboxyltransferase domain-containing protein [Terrimicrobiaceae bacterium]
MENVKVSRFGPRALLIDFAEEVDEGSLARCRGLIHSLEESSLDGLSEITPAYLSLLVEFSNADKIAGQSAKLDDVLRSARALPSGEVPLRKNGVCYDGPDLEEFARRNRLSVSDIIELHTLPVYSVFLIGFAPGFPYLGPLDSRLHAPRLDTPCPRVPAGSVAIGGVHTGIYRRFSRGREARQ